MSDGSSWRSPSTADQYRHHDYADFAQEYLQRNPDYRSDYAETEARVAARPDVELIEREGLAGRWGLCFPHCARIRSQNSTSPVVPSRSARRRCVGNRRYRGSSITSVRL
ncbi:transcriptional regulator domain-containing protein [Sphingobium xenophagum]|uniref:transcriptional regulator domain-containing protein n=1 Tax=Sphingobium xenophagum TaxID=121428 RepID=UPI0020CD0A7A|nr:DUF6499 domain-containing protein [Sphingobium xenophagum]